MQIAQERTSIGCLLSLAAGWLAISLVMQKNLALDFVFVGVLIIAAIYLTIYRRVYGGAVLTIDAPPEPGHALRGKIQTPLKSEPPSGCKLRIVAMSRSRRASSMIWRSEQMVHPIRGERGLILPVEFSIPAEVEKSVVTDWALTASATMFPLPYRATFAIAAQSSSSAPQSGS